jgi:hypothetical protein
MTSIGTFDEVLSLLPKAAALLLPVVYSTWNKARQRPVVTVERREGKIAIATGEREPIKKLALRLTRPGIIAADVRCESKGFTGFEIQQVSANEVRVCFDRFGEHDQIDVLRTSALTIDIIDSEAVPVHGRPHHLLWVLDWAVLLAALAVLAAFVIAPIEGRFVDQTAFQYQDNVDHALQSLILSVACGLVLAGALLVAETMLIVSRRRRALVQKSLNA